MNSRGLFADCSAAEYTITIFRAQLISGMRLTVSLLHDTLRW